MRTCTHKSAWLLFKYSVVGSFNSFDTFKYQEKKKMLFLLVLSSRVQLDSSQVSTANVLNIELNTRKEIPYLQETMYYFGLLYKHLTNMIKKTFLTLPFIPGAKLSEWRVSCWLGVLTAYLGCRNFSRYVSSHGWKCLYIWTADWNSSSVNDPRSYLALLKQKREKDLKNSGLKWSQTLISAMLVQWSTSWTKLFESTL